MTADINEVVAQIRKGDKIGLLVYLHHGGDANARNSMGWTLLHIASFEGKTEIVQILLDNGAQVNACTTDMATPLHRASSQGCRGAVAALLNKNAYVNAQDKNGNTALHEAAKGAYTSIVKALINQKADKEKLNNRKQRFTDLVGQQLMPAVASGDTETLTLWLDWGLSPDTCGSLGWSLLHHASVSGQTEVAALLIERGARVEILDSNKSTALHAASFHGSKDIVKLLLKNGANPNLQDQRGNTSLHSAVSGSHAEIINLLLEGGADTSIPNHENMVFKHIVKDVLVKTVHEGKTSQVTALLRGHADPDTRDAFGTPLVCVAAFNKDLLVVDALLEAGADPNLSSTDSKKTALHYAAFWDDLFIMKSLLDHKAKVDPVDRFGNTPLHEAANEGHVDVITMLTGRLAAINTPNSDGNTPLHLAAKAGETAAVELLLEKGANESLVNKNGQLYHDLALINAVRTEMPDKVTAGLAWGGNPNTKDQKGWTLLHHAVFKGSLEITSMLLECEAAVDEVDVHGRTALILAAYRGNCAIVSRLIEAGANMEQQDIDGQTALHWAAREGSVETVLYLIDHGADTAIKDASGRFFKHWLVKHLYLAVRHSEAEKVDALLSAGADQFARVEGTEVTPREEAKRRKCFPILKLMAARSQLTQAYEEEFDFWNMPAIEDLRVLFKEEDSSDEDSEEEAEWKMKNAEVVVSAKELFADDNEELWEVWDEKPKWITAKELYQEDVEDFWQSWEETPEKPRQRSRSPPPPARSEDDSETESEEESDESEDSQEEDVRKSQEELQRDAEGKFFFAIPAQEIFKEDSSWLDEFDDSKYSSSKAIPAKEAFKDDESWLESDDEDKYKPSESIPAKEAFKEDDLWLNNLEDVTFEQSKAIPAREAFKEDDTWLNSDDECEYKSVNAIPAKEAFKEDDSWLDSDSDNDSTLATDIPDKEAFKEDESLVNSDDESGFSHSKASAVQEAIKEDDSWLNDEDSESAHSYSSDDEDTENCARNQLNKAVTDETSWLEEEDDSGYSSTKLALPKENSELLSHNQKDSTSKRMRRGICSVDGLKDSLPCKISALDLQDSENRDGWKNCEVSQNTEKLAIASVEKDASENLENSPNSSDESISNMDVLQARGNSATDRMSEGNSTTTRFLRRSWSDKQDSTMRNSCSSNSDSFTPVSSNHLRMRSCGNKLNSASGDENDKEILSNSVTKTVNSSEIQQNCSEGDTRGVLTGNCSKVPKSFSECFGFAFGRPNNLAHNDELLVPSAVNSKSYSLSIEGKHSVIADDAIFPDSTFACSFGFDECVNSEEASFMSEVLHSNLPTDGKNLQCAPLYKVSSNREKSHFPTTFTTSKAGLMSLNSDYNPTVTANHGIPRNFPEFKTGGFGSFRFSELMTRDENDYKQLERTESLSSSSVESCSQVCLLSEPEVVQRVLVRLPATTDSSLEEIDEDKPFTEESKGMNPEDDPRVTELFDKILLNLLDYHPEEDSVEKTVNFDACIPKPPSPEITDTVSISSDVLASENQESNLDGRKILTSSKILADSSMEISDDVNDTIEKTFDFCESADVHGTLTEENTDYSEQCGGLPSTILKDDVTESLVHDSHTEEENIKCNNIPCEHTDSNSLDFQARVPCSTVGVDVETQNAMISGKEILNSSEICVSSTRLEFDHWKSLNDDQISQLRAENVNKMCLVRADPLPSHSVPGNIESEEHEDTHSTNLSLMSETHTVTSAELPSHSSESDEFRQNGRKQRNDSFPNSMLDLEDKHKADESILPSTSGIQREESGHNQTEPRPDTEEVAVVLPVEEISRDIKLKHKQAPDGSRDSVLTTFISFCVFILFITSYLLLKWFT